MARIQTTISDSWGEITTFSIDGRDDVRSGINYVFQPNGQRPYAILIVADRPDEIQGVTVNEQDAVRMDIRGQRVFVATTSPDSKAVNVRIFLNQDVESSSVHLGFFARFRRRVRGLVNDSLNRLRDRCFACRALVRTGISLVTGGGDVAGEATGVAVDELQEKLDEWFGDTILDEILEVLKNAANPGRLAASEVCRKLGYCP